MKIAVTGANSSVGQNLLAHVAARTDLTALGIVRSDRAAAQLPVAENLAWEVVDYREVDALASVLAGVAVVVHLVGVLFEAPGVSYEEANVESTRYVVDAARRAGVDHVIFVSALGADARAGNRYYRSKGEAEAVVAGFGRATTSLRTPMLLGPESAAGIALLAMAQRSSAFLLGGGRQVLRPLDLDDLSRGILAAAGHPPEGGVVRELVGPEAITHRKLLRRVAARLDNSVRIVPVPVTPVRFAAAVGRRLLGRGPSPDVIDVITAAETIADNADTALGIELTPLDTTLDKLVGER